MKTQAVRQVLATFKISKWCIIALKMPFQSSLFGTNKQLITRLAKYRSYRKWWGCGGWSHSWSTADADGQLKVSIYLPIMKPVQLFDHNVRSQMMTDSRYMTEQWKTHIAYSICTYSIVSGNAMHVTVKNDNNPLKSCQIMVINDDTEANIRIYKRGWWKNN